MTSMPNCFQSGSGYSPVDSEAARSHPAVLIVATFYRPAFSLCDYVFRLSRSIKLDEDARPTSDVHVLLYDNSPSCDTSLAPLITPIRYEHHPENGGTRAALLRAVELAVELRLDWILTLDQDSTLPSNFLSAAFAQLNLGPRTAAMVPDVFHNGKRVSPCRVNSVGRILPCRSARENIDTAVLSGSILSVAHLSALGKPPELFWLDFLDHWIFRSFRRQKLEILGIPVRIEHQLSVSIPDQIPTWRMQNILRSEQVFVTGEEGVIIRWAYPARLVLRLVKQLPLRSPLWRITWNALRKKFD